MKPVERKFGDLLGILHVEWATFGFYQYPEIYKTLLKWKFGKKDYEIYVHYRGNKIVAYCLMKGATIDRIAVKEEFRSEGIGASIVPGYANKAKTFKWRKKAIKFYKKIGFKAREYSAGVILTRKGENKNE